MSGAPKGSSMSNSGLSQAVPIGGREPLQIKPFGAHARAGPDKQGRCKHPMSRLSQTFTCHRISKLESQVSELGIMTPLSP